MTSAHVAYDPDLFVLEWDDAGTWTPVQVASFTCATDYAADEHGTLIFQTETASVAINFWAEPDPRPLYPGDKIQAWYGPKLVFTGTVDTTRCVANNDPAAQRRGATGRWDFTASAIGPCAAALSTVFCWTELPGESAIDRVRRFVTVENWAA